MHSSTVLRSPRESRRPCTSIFIAALILLGGRAAYSQTLFLTPNCLGPDGGSFHVSGAGWSKPFQSQYMNYYASFRGSDQGPQDAKGHQPYFEFNLPSATTTGKYPVHVELRDDDRNGAVVQCREVDLCVLASVQSQPWSLHGDVGITMPFERIIVKFDPQGVCTQAYCDRIVFKQSVTQLGHVHDSDPPVYRSLSYAEQDAPDKGRDRFRNPETGTSMDLSPGQRSDDTYDFMIEVGKLNCDEGKKASMDDMPVRGNQSYPPDIDQIRLIYEINAYCADGPATGRPLGQATLSWERNLGASIIGGHVIVGQGSLAEPTPAFLAARKQFLDNAVKKKSKKPSREPQNPSDGGRSCQ